MAHPGGRPIEYNDEVPKKAQEYLDKCVDEEDEYHKTRGEKSDSYDRIIRVRLPTIEGLAVHLGISRATVYDWKEKYPEFSDIIEKLQSVQADRLLLNGLSGDYNPVIAKVLLTKHGYREGIEQTGKDGKDLIPDQMTDAEKLKLKELLK